MAMKLDDAIPLPIKKHVVDYKSDEEKTATARRATLLPLVASTLSPLSSPVTSPTGSPPGSPRASPSSALLGLSSVGDNGTNTNATTTTTKEHTSTSMTVAKLDPNNADGGIDVLSPTAGFSPPLSPLSNKKSSSFSSSTTSTTTTTTTTFTTENNKTAPTTTTHTETTKTTTNGKSGNTKYEVFDKETGEKVQRSRPLQGPKMNPVYKALRAFAWALYFNLGASLISMTQVLSLPLAVIAPGVYRRHINRTEGHFGAFLLKMNQFFAPSDIVLTGDESIRGIVKVYKGRRLQHGKDGEKVKDEKTYGKEETILDMPERMIFISNHQIYSDWMYLWCFSYFAEKHRALKIILRGDLTWIPGMRFFDFILLKRNDWAHDKRAIEENLDRVNAKDPLWLVVFPEGTVVSRGTRKRSSTFAKKAGLADHRHVLLPRTSGLFVCINKLRGSVEYLYDATVGYSGIAYGEIPQELYPLPGLYLNQAQPKDINMHLRRFAIKEIPETEAEFVEWVRQRWQEKDELMEEFYTTGKFPSQLTLEDIGGGKEDSEEKKEVVKEKGGVSVRIPLKSRAMLDYLSPAALNVIALPMVALAIRYALQYSS
ncbi:hypothetical protein EC957_007914 [Mortierella hygrophila]|uniref:Phospholipid/glycerol acyltransferase domain-containing protein n=1 Tax=Mortierella hygrophila TaxID=979708 RepID=A0A9P6FDJ6_9FUNG|nr:hypothetical protein EC957_007914 [Mortierella hygrophila]